MHLYQWLHQKKFFFSGQFLWKMLEREFWSRWIIWATWSLLIGRAEDIEFLDINHVEFARPRLLEFEHRSPHPHWADLRIVLILYFAFFFSFHHSRYPCSKKHSWHHDIAKSSGYTTCLGHVPVHELLVEYRSLVYQWVLRNRWLLV